MPGQSRTSQKRRPAPVIPITRERALMDRARQNAELDHEKPRRSKWATVAAILLTIAVVFTLGRGFDAFLGGFQRLLERIAREEAVIEARKPQPVYVVPDGAPAAPADAPTPPAESPRE